MHLWEERHLVEGRRMNILHRRRNYAKRHRLLNRKEDRCFCANNDKRRWNWQLKKGHSVHSWALLPKNKIKNKGEQLSSYRSRHFRNYNANTFSSQEGCSRRPLNMQQINLQAFSSLLFLFSLQFLPYHSRNGFLFLVRGTWRQDNTKYGHWALSACRQWNIILLPIQKIWKVILSSKFDRYSFNFLTKIRKIWRVQQKAGRKTMEVSYE